MVDQRRRERHPIWRLQDRSEGTVKMIVFACRAAVIIAVVGAVALSNIQEPVAKAFSTSAVRLGR
jgi:hypothetical protein